VYSLGGAKLKLIGLDPDQDATQSCDDGLRIWSTLKKSTPHLEQIGIKPGAKLLVLQSLRPTLEKLESDIASVFPEHKILDTGESFVGAILFSGPSEDKDFTNNNIQNILTNNEQLHKNILVTGVSGTGKSALCEELKKMGYQAYDLEMMEGYFAMHKKGTGEKISYRFDNNNLKEMEKYDWLCDIPKLKELIEKNKDKTVFYCCTGSNINDLMPLFDKTILLTASEDVLRHRLTTRTSNDYGKSTEIQDWTFSWKDWWEDNVRELGVIEIDANQNLEKVASDIIEQINN
jgi:broad-specificity NMP kinase